MIFSSTIFLFVFLPLVLGGYFLIKTEYRNLFLLLVSLGFYAWGEPKFVLVMILSILINYISGLAIYYGKNHYSKNINRIILFLGVMGNLIPLFYFKYFDFFISSVNSLIGLEIPLRNIVLPIGISFFTFQGMSYILDLYMDKVEVQKKFINLALYVSLFPQLIAGPIIRYKDVNEQINYRNCTLNKFAEGIRRFVIGLSKKTIIANNVGFVADQIFSNVPNENSITIAWIGIICYSLQIYFDFSGYSDMAIGLGKMFGFEFLENFNYPYISKSVTEFWRRWHISLSTWFRDYVYIPLGGNRTGNMYFNLIVVFLVTGLWHGAAWNFILWGLWHGIFLIIEKVLRQKNISFNLPKQIRWALTMLVVVLGWVLFRAPDLKFAIEYIGVMFGIIDSSNVAFTVGWYLKGKVKYILILGILMSFPIKKYIYSLIKYNENLLIQEVIKNITIIVLFLISIMFIMTSTYNPFIYFRF